VSREAVREGGPALAPTAPLHATEAAAPNGLAGLIDLADSLSSAEAMRTQGGRRAATAQPTPAPGATNSSRSRRWAVAAAVLTLAAAGVAAVAITRDRGGGDAGAALWEPEVGTLTQERRFPELELLVRTPATVTPDAVASSFRAAWGAFATFLAARGIGEAPAPAVRVIAVVPRAALCKQSTYSGVEPPAACATAVHAFRVVDQTLVVVDNEGDWSRAMRFGISEAVCAAGPSSRPCELAPEFALEAEGGSGESGANPAAGPGGGDGGPAGGRGEPGSEPRGKGAKSGKGGARSAGGEKSRANP
jgi:hypothetical protein